MQKLSYWLLAIACCFSLMAKAQTDEVKGNRTAGHLGIRNYGIDHDYAYIVGHKCADHEHAEMSAEKLVDGALMLLAGDCYTEQEQRLTYFYDKEISVTPDGGGETTVYNEVVVKKNNGIVQNPVANDNRGLTGFKEASFDPDRANKTLSYGNPDLFRGVIQLVDTKERFRVDSQNMDFPVFKLKFWYTGNYIAPVGSSMHLAVSDAENAGKYVFVHAKYGEPYIANIWEDRNKDGHHSEAVEVHHIHKILCVNPEESHKDAPYLLLNPDGSRLTSHDGWDDNIPFADAEPAEGSEAPKEGHNRCTLFRLVPVEPGWAFTLNYKYQVTDEGLEYMQSDIMSTETWEGDDFVPESNFDFYTLKQESFEVTQDYSAAAPLIVPCASTWPVSFTQNISIGMPFPDNTAWHMLYANDDSTKWVNYDMNTLRASFDPYAVGRGYMWAFRWVKWPNEAAAYNMASDKAYSLGIEENTSYRYSEEHPDWYNYNQDWAQLSRAKLEQFFIFLRNGNGFSMAFPDHDAQGTLTTNARLGYNGEEQYGTANQLVIGYNGLSSSEQKNRLVADRIKAETLIEEAASIYYPVRQADKEPRRVGAYTATQDEIDAYNASVTTWKNNQTIEESIETMIDNYVVVKPTEIVHTPEGYYRLVVKNGVRPGNNASDVVVVGPQKVKGQTAAESMGTDWKYRQIFVRSKIVADPNDGLPYNYTFSYYDGLWQIEESDGKMRFKHANSDMYMLQPDAPVWLSAEDYANVDYDFEHTGESSNIWFLWGREKGKTDFQKVGVNQWGLLSNDYGDDLWAQWYVEEVTKVPLKVSNTNGDGTGYASLCLPFAVELPDGLTAYYASGIGTNKVELSEITDGIVPAHTGVLVSGAADNYQLSIVQTNKVVTDNQFVGTTLRTTGFAKDEMYVYAKGYSDADESYLGYGFYLNAAKLTAVPANKLYIPAGGVASGARALSLHLGGAETDIEKNLMPNGGDGSEVYYDINGQRVLYPSNGIFVTKSGKKVFIR